MSLEYIRSVLARWLDFINPISRSRRRKLLLVRFERELLSAEYREARVLKQRQRQSRLVQRLSVLMREELSLIRGD